MISLPFRVSNTHAGWSVTKGMLVLQEDGLLVQFESADAMLGLLKSPMREITIPYDTIVGSRLRKGFLADDLFIEVNDMKSLKRVSWRDGSLFGVRLQKSYRKTAEEFVDDLDWRADL